MFLLNFWIGNLLIVFLWFAENDESVKMMNRIWISEIFSNELKRIIGLSTTYNQWIMMYHLGYAQNKFLIELVIEWN